MVNKSWLQRQSSDYYVKQAKEQGYRSRAAFKLLDIDARDRLLRPGMQVIDLGAAPGGWSQVVQQKVGPKGLLVSIDILSMEPLVGVQFMQGDFESESLATRLRSLLRGGRADLIISDMAPNLSGVRAADQARSFALAESALNFVQEFLIEGGSFLIKLFQGSELTNYRNQFKGHFKQVLIRKPKASRSESRELYLLGYGHCPKNSDLQQKGTLL